MLAFNSYGLQRSSGNNSSSHHNASAAVSLPPLSLGSPCGRGAGTLALLRQPRSPFPPPPRAAHSLTKLELLQRHEHPLYRTTTGYDYGRHVELHQDSARSVPKHGRHAEFTHEFVAGPFQDTSLTSIDKSKQRAERWERKVEERTKQMRVKHEQLQQKLEARKEARKLERESRRREMAQRQRAAVAIQALFRGCHVRAQIRYEYEARATVAAVTIQRSFRAHIQVKRAKEVLASRRRARLDVFATKLQRASKRYLLRQDARRQASARRRERNGMSHKRVSSSSVAARHQQSGSRRRSTDEDAAAVIQRAVRGHLDRRAGNPRSTTSSALSSTAGDCSAKDESQSGPVLSGRSASSSFSSPAGSSAAKNRIARRAIVSMKHRKNDKSQRRINS
ncbi:hypothetical protein ATCC90586_009276 [Pythium insidiosum]|nr:hypothetical protein ATCC90586_009276 [Pythium insidiosum]